jgi:hypothetical protein
VILELELPALAGRGAWERLALRISRDATVPLRLQVFDWAQQQWVRAGGLPGRPEVQSPRRVSPWPSPSPSSTEMRTVALASPGRLVNPHTDTLLVRLENGAAASPGGISVEVSGDGHAR